MHSLVIRRMYLSSEMVGEIGERGRRADLGMLS